MKCPRCGNDRYFSQNGKLPQCTSCGAGMNILDRIDKLEKVLEAARDFHAKHAEINDDEGEKLFYAIREADDVQLK